MKQYAILRPRNQITLPQGFVERLDLEAGDTLDIKLGQGGLIIKPRRKQHANSNTQNRRDD